MMTLDGAAQLCLALPEVTEVFLHRGRGWSVAGKRFAWERPFTKADLKRFGDQTPPSGQILAASVADLSEKEAVLAAHPTAVFTIEHFDGYPAILIQLNKATKKQLQAVLVDAWLVAAPQVLVDQYLRS